MPVIENIGYILLGFMIIVLAFLIILALLEKKFHLRFLSRKNSRNEFYIAKISKIKINNPEIVLKEISNISKDFFREAFHIKGNPDFSELQEYFFKKNNRKATIFCGDIVEHMYSKQNISYDKVKELVETLAEIIAANRIITKEEKEELDKKSAKKESFLGKIHIPSIGQKETQEQED
jgi:hypothetical protein